MSSFSLCAGMQAKAHQRRLMGIYMYASNWKCLYHGTHQTFYSRRCVITVGTDMVLYGNNNYGYLTVAAASSIPASDGRAGP